MLTKQRILLGISAGIAAYKTPQLVRDLVSSGAEVRVVLTNDAKKLVAPLALQAVSGYPVQTSLWEGEAGFAMDHIELAKWATIILIAPATANVLAKLAIGIADDLLTTIILATKAPIYVAPAMNQAMWQHRATVENIKTLKARGVTVLGPESGEQACGDAGPGRMREPIDLVTDLLGYLGQEDLGKGSRVLQDKVVLITAGPTQEAWDPVRFLSNHSTGHMGFALAGAAARAGANVILVTGPVQLQTPPGVSRIDIITAAEMAEVVYQQMAEVDIFIAAAAVADFRPRQLLDQKLKKSVDVISLELERTEDIVATVGLTENRPFIVGFAAETDHVLDNARTKRIAKNMDLIVANQVGVGFGFGEGPAHVWLLSEVSEQALAATSKEALAPKLMDRIVDQWLAQGSARENQSR
jgi:phosphopantothenoylcysteine decarboxylase/phosphopantothenate--cysteine ligase